MVDEKKEETDRAAPELGLSLSITGTSEGFSENTEAIIAAVRVFEALARLPDNTARAACLAKVCLSLDHYDDAVRFAELAREWSKLERPQK
jgi:hypothetical protein